MLLVGTLPTITKPFCRAFKRSGQTQRSRSLEEGGLHTVRRDTDNRRPGSLTKRRGGVEVRHQDISRRGLATFRKSLRNERDTIRVHVAVASDSAGLDRDEWFYGFIG